MKIRPILLAVAVSVLAIPAASAAAQPVDEPPTPTELDPCLDTDGDRVGSTLVYRLPCDVTELGRLTIPEWCASGYASPYLPGDASDPCAALPGPPTALPVTGVASPRIAGLAGLACAAGVGLLLLRRRPAVT